MPTVTTNYFRQELANKNISLSGETFYVSLMGAYVSSTTSTILQSISAWSAVSANESSSVGYSAATISGETVSINGTTNTIEWKGNNITWGPTTNSPYGLCIYRNDGLVVGFIDFGKKIDAINGNITIQWNSKGIANII